MNESDRTRAIEAMARAGYDAEWEDGWELTGEIERALARQIASAALDALLSLRTEEVCKTCGTGLNARIRDAIDEFRRRGVDDPSDGCPDCSDGTTPGTPLVFTADQVKAALSELPRIYALAVLARLSTVPESTGETA